MKELLFGTAGIPLSSKGLGTISGISKVKELGLGAMELEFVRNVNIQEHETGKVKEAAKNGVVLSCHASYFINLNAKDMKILEASRNRLLKAAKIAGMCGAWSVCVHAAYYLGMEKESVYENVKRQIASVVNILQQNDLNIWVRPETPGKKTQFGSLQESLRLSNELEQVMPCIDFAHMHAVEGKNNSYDEFASILQEVEKSLGREGLENMHIHMSGINYAEKGERNHLVLNESDMKYEELMAAFRDFKVKGVVINESPNIEEDALLLQKVYKRVSQK
ncbi:MAG: TIM barrel protein [Candidatus Woesearchaeota archaeon]